MYDVNPRQKNNLQSQYNRRQFEILDKSKRRTNRNISEYIAVVRVRYKRCTDRSISTLFRCALSWLAKHQGMTITHTDEMRKNNYTTVTASYRKDVKLRLIWTSTKKKRNGYTDQSLAHTRYVLVRTPMHINEQVRQFSPVDYCVVGIDVVRAALIEGLFV